MKVFLKKNRWKLLLIAAVYLVSLALCILILASVPYLSHRAFLTRTLGEAAGQFSETGSLEGCELYGIGAVIYDGGGAVYQSVAPTHLVLKEGAEAFFTKYTGGALPKVLRGETGKAAVQIRFIPARNMQLIIIGTKVEHVGEPYALFLVRDQHDAYRTLIAAGIFYSLIYFLGSALFIYTLRKSQKLDKMQRDYLANLSHDLKSPISSIRVLAEAMQSRLEPSDTENHRCFDVMIGETFQLEHTVKDILELSSLQSSGGKLAKSKVSLQVLFQPVFEKYESLADDMLIDFRIGEEFASLAPVNTNGKSIVRVMEILLDNAVKFLRFEGEIDVDFRSDTQKVTVCVRDNGDGISREEQKKIYDRFYMGDHSHNTKGSGLGLSIAKEIISSLDEKLWVESEPGKGASFYFTVHY